SGRCLSRQYKADAAAAGFAVFGPDAAAVGLDDPARDSQPQPRAASRPAAGLLAPIELLEYRRQVDLGETGAAVFHGYQGSGCADAPFNKDLAARRRVVKRVIDQVIKYPPDLSGVHGHRIDGPVNIPH